VSPGSRGGATCCEPTPVASGPGPPSAPIVTVDRSTVTALDLADHRGLDWSRVYRAAYLIHQVLRYEYPSPIETLDHRLLIIPPARHGDQRLIVERVDVSTFPVESADASAVHAKSVQREVVHDSFGNTVLCLRVPRVERAIEFEAWVVVERGPGGSPMSVPPSTLSDVRLRESSVLTTPDDALRSAAATLLAHGDRGVSLAERISAMVFEHMAFTRGATTVRTTAAEAFALRRGVCQDYAHVMLALCRLCGLAARYVSGHLLGEGGSHAWVEVILPAADGAGEVIAVALDPTHACRAGLDYLTVAVGRDYADVAPTSGTFRGAHAGQLSASKRAGITAVEYARAPAGPLC
jgi:transglutaminase-like putative cysteine protease